MSRAKFATEEEATVAIAALWGPRGEVQRERLVARGARGGELRGDVL